MIFQKKTAEQYSALIFFTLSQNT